MNEQEFTSKLIEMVERHNLELKGLHMKIRDLETELQTYKNIEKKRLESRKKIKRVK